MTAAIEAFVAGLPKVELHVHLEGSLRADTRQQLADRHGVALRPRPAGVPFVDFDDFIAAYIEGFALIRDAVDIVTITAALAADLAANQVHYAEVTSTAFAYLSARRMAPAAYREALDEGRAVAWRDHGVELAWVLDIPRGVEAPDAGVTADLLCGSDCPAGTVAIGLGGPEIGYPAPDYAASFERAAAIGLRSVPHGGETAGAAYVRDCIDVLHADRIGHGVMAVDDPTVLALLVERATPLEVCPTSNVLLGVSVDHDHHPLGRLRAAGVTLTIATDDPGYFDTDLCRELLIAHRHHGCSAEDLRRLQLDGLACSFAGEATRRRLRREIEGYQSSM